MVADSWLLTSLALSSAIAAYGFRKCSLDKSGAVCAMLVGFCSFFTSAKFGFVLIAFFLTSSKITKIGSARKRALEEDFKEGGQRTWSQVLANSVPGLAACCAHWLLFGSVMFPLDGAHFPLATFLQAAYLGHYACCAGDTWASELGVLATGRPILVTSCRRVPTGTNGGVSPLGLAASAIGGLCMGACFAMFAASAQLVSVAALDSAPDVLALARATMRDPSAHIRSPVSAAALVALVQAAEARRWAVSLAIGAAAGFCGSMIDSFLGAVFQYSGFCGSTNKVVSAPAKSVTHITGVALLSNSQVNFVSSLLTAALSGYAAMQYA